MQSGRSTNDRGIKIPGCAFSKNPYADQWRQAVLVVKADSTAKTSSTSSVQALPKLTAIVVTAFNKFLDLIWLEISNERRARNH